MANPVPWHKVAESRSRSRNQFASERSEQQIQLDCERALYAAQFPSRHLEAITRGRIKWTYPEQRRKIRAAGEALRARPSAILALLGLRGVGKTQAACVLAWNRCVELKGCSLLYCHTGDLMDDRRAYMDDRRGKQNPIEVAAEVDLLILDELQERRESEWENEQLARLVDRRYRQERPTILVGNLTREHLATYSDSIMSRIQEEGAIVNCDWPSLREFEGEEVSE